VVSLAEGKFDASDLAYDKTFACFTATDLNGYAVTGATPTPTRFPYG
jgi:hypothetical protein